MNIVTTKYNLVLTMFISLLFSGCATKVDRLEYALEFAGENRRELEEVLEYYSNDSLKYRAACFLIENMPRWYAYDGWQLDTLEVLMRKDREGNLSKEDKMRWNGFDYHTLNKIYDSKVITSEYLIENIDLAFQEWKNRPWNRTLSFDDFCELILPYRIGNERLSNWRSLYNAYYGNLLDSVYTGSDVLVACKCINDELNRQNYKYSVEWNVPHNRADYLFKTRIGYCREVSDLIQYAMRSCGIPVAADFMPYSPDYRYSHEWNVVRDTTGRYIQFGFDGLDPVRDKVPDDGRRKGKVFRYCYALQNEREILRKHSGWNIGGTEGLYWKDVTSEYFGHNRAAVNVCATEKPLIALSVFSTNGWLIIGEGVYKSSGKALFDNIEPFIIYVPVSQNNGVEPIGYPFMLDSDGHVEEFVPDTVNLEKIILKRKMALIPRVAAWGYSQIGARIEGDIDTDFKSPKLIAEIKDTMDYTFQVLEGLCSEPVKYIRYVPPVGLLQLAELKLYKDTILKKEIKITPLTDVPYIEKVIDGDILSHIYQKSEGVIDPLVFSLDSLQQIRRLYFIARTDDNYVWKGDTYELLYFNGIDGWKSLGVKTATSEYICFEAPRNALLWLRNRTKGREEQVFIYRNNRQWFNSNLNLIYNNKKT
ncbi:transglutaminase domain-containing protein [uncultured Bacteroides sp.]|uniref:transglutaminase domain-containing protein n=1 Tax=uncultured Bacteroides sp. TaxID=162156 RepID=UPI0025914407|nr:transglutaminase domain-containing protein [uncultured Bacteroides sp.]